MFHCNLVFWHSKMFSKVSLTGLYFDILSCSQRFVWLVCNLVFWHSKLFSKVCLTGLYFDFDILSCSQRFVWLVCILSFVLAFGHSKMIWMIYEISNKHLEIICFNAIYFLLQVFHKIITTGHQRLQPLFDCLLTIIVNGKKN